MATEDRSPTGLLRAAANRRNTDASNAMMPETLPLTEPSEEPPKRLFKTWKVLGLLVVVHAAFGAYFTPLGKPVSDTAPVAPCLLIGFILSQPLMFAIWASLASQRFYHRFLWSLLLCSLVSFVDEIGSLRNPHAGRGNGMICSIAVFIVATLLLSAFRRFSRWQIRKPNVEDVPSDYRANQFGIKHLIILTTITALACGLCRTLLSTNHDLDRLPSIVQFAGFILILCVLLVPILAIPWYTLSLRGKIVPLLVSTIMIGAACDLAAFCIITAMTPPAVGRADIYQEVIKPSLLIQFGAGASVLVTMLVIRWCGFRMMREPRP
ncbi:MAG: hypothetical protein ABFC96_14705 [Thermoguttaceae bacterium]